MGRPPKFSADEILDKALPVFWRRGFAATTLEELETATGLGRQCLYNQFTDKQGLYRAALRRYGEHADAMVAPLRAPDATLETVQDFFDRARKRQRSIDCGGCMFARLAAEKLDDPEVAAIAAAGTKAVRAAITAIVAREIARGRIRDSRPAGQIADFLWSVNTGVSSLGLSEDGDAAGANVTRLAIDLLTAQAVPA
jgi:TetR/AcrR family transcriptional repressor of nem operon